MPWESKEYLILLLCVCSLNYSADNAHAPYYVVVWVLSNSIHIFPQYIIKGNILGGREWTWDVFWFSVQFLPEIFFILRSTKRDIINTNTNVHRSSSTAPSFLSSFDETWIFWIDFKFNENPFIGSRVVPCRRTDRHDEASSCFSQFSERAQYGPLLPLNLHWLVHRRSQTRITCLLCQPPRSVHGFPHGTLILLSHVHSKSETLTHTQRSAIKCDYQHGK